MKEVYEEELEQNLTENQKAFGEKLGSTIDYLQEGNYDLLPPEHKYNTLKEYFMGVTDSLFLKEDEKTRKQAQENLSTLFEREEFHNLMVTVINSRLTGNEITSGPLAPIIVNPLKQAKHLLQDKSLMEKSDEELTVFFTNANEKLTQQLTKQSAAPSQSPSQKEVQAEHPLHQKIQYMKAQTWMDQLDSVDPWWMTKSSKEFGDVKKALIKLKEHEAKAPKRLNSTRSYRNYATEHLEKIAAVEKAIDKYIARKQKQFQDDPTRRDTAKKQSYEQKRIAVMLNLKEGMALTKDRIIRNGKKFMNDTMERLSRENNIKGFGEEFHIFDKMHTHHQKDFVQGSKKQLQDSLLSNTSKQIMNDPAQKQQEPKRKTL